MPTCTAAACHRPLQLWFATLVIASAMNPSLPTPTVGDKPHQPTSFHFPQREFGKTAVQKRYFQPQWFKRWSWLHYDEERDLAFCFTCVVAYKQKHLHAVPCLEKTFLSTGYSNWKDAVSKFTKHESSRCHQKSVLKTCTLPSTTGNIGEMLCSQLATLRSERRHCFLKILSNVRFLARQGLAFRGDGDESDSNFMRLVNLRSEDDAKLVEWVQQKTGKYTSAAMQNEMVKVMGLSVLSGAKSGVVKRMCDIEPRAVYTHCYGHALNLACGDTIRQCKLMRDALDTTYEICKLVKKSPRCDATFKRLKEEMANDSPGVRVLCPTRWTVRAQALKSIVDNFNVLCELWDESLEHVKDTEMKARIQGVAAQMKAFDFFFGVSLGFLLLQHSDNLSRTMQRADMSAAEGQEVVAMTLSTLCALRNEPSFDMFWRRVCDSSSALGVDRATLPRRRKIPRRLDDGAAPAFPETVEEHYRVIYFEALDLITSCIKDRFNQPGYKTKGAQSIYA